MNYNLVESVIYDKSDWIAEESYDINGEVGVIISKGSISDLFPVDMDTYFSKSIKDYINKIDYFKYYINSFKLKLKLITNKIFQNV